jgi:thiol-disulfide isomerase/thioredoxin
MRTALWLPLLLVIGTACGHPSFPASAAHTLLGQPLPEIRHRTTLDGQPFEAARLAGKPVLVKFFADYCIPCKETLPAVERIHETHPEVFFLGIDEDESTETASSLARRFGLTHPVIHDSGNILSARFRGSRPSRWCLKRHPDLGGRTYGIDGRPFGAAQHASASARLAQLGPSGRG